MKIYCKYCGGRHTRGERCEKAPARQRAAHDNDIAKFRNSRRWKEKAHAIKERDGYLCRLCLAEHKFTREELEVHHIVPLSEDFSLRLEDKNLITLCWYCHQSAHNDISGKIRQKLKKLAVQNPAETI